MADKKPKKAKFKFKYIIPDHIKDCYVNGAWGGITPRGEIHMHPYSERHPIPMEHIYDIGKKGSMAEPGKTIKGADAVRVVQSSLIFDVQTAINIRNWLDGMISMLTPPEDKGTVKKELKP